MRPFQRTKGLFKDWVDGEHGNRDAVETVQALFLDQLLYDSYLKSNDINNNEIEIDMINNVLNL